MSQKLSTGRIVHYRLSKSDVTNINSQRAEGHGSHGNPVAVGEVVPAIVVKAWSDECFNGQAILDGNDRLWLTSVVQGDEPGQWSWPPRV